MVLTVEDIAESNANTVTAQQESLNSLASVVLDNRIVLDYLFTGQGVCAVANTTCCTWINTSG